MRIETVGGPPHLRARTARAVRDVGEQAGIGTWFVRAGTWNLGRPSLPSSATGKPLLAFGAARNDPTWQAWLSAPGDPFMQAGRRPRAVSVLTHEPSALVARIRGGESFDNAAWALAASGRYRTVHAHALDLDWDPHVRACVVVTPLRRGGAERIAIDLARATRSRLVVLGKADGDAYDAPEAVSLVRGVGAPLRALALTHGADVVHAHLLPRQDLRVLAAMGLPVVVTVHNDPARWLAGVSAVIDPSVALSLGCSWRVTDALAAVTPRTRVAPNFTTHRRARTRTGPLVRILCVANVRAQKRLDLAVEVLAVLRQEGVDAQLTIAGRVVEPEAKAVVDAVVARRALAPHVAWCGPQADPRPLYAAADVLLTTSLYEGMSVAQLEALATGLPVVTTDVGGARELAATHAHYRVAAANAPALAQAVREVVPGESELAPFFQVDAAARRHVRAWRGAATADHARAGLVLVINNLATGGAQASARRLLRGLAARGHRVAVAVLEEQSRTPSPWRTDVARALPVHDTVAREATAAAEEVCAFVREREAATVVFWNVRPTVKLLVADELVGCALYDVSPGEMYFAELDRYFARPRADLPYFTPRDYGSLLRGVVVKYEAEAVRARELLGAPVTVIPNGVAHGARAPSRSSSNGVVVGTLARLSPDKKLEQLLAAVAEVTPSLPGSLDVRIAGRVARGDEPYAATLRADARHLPVTFVGDVEADAFLADLDVFAMVSEPAGCPNALLEAMAAGLPVAATSAGGAADIVGDAGLLVARGDSCGLARAIHTLADDAALRARYGRAARERVAERFSLDRMLDAYARLLLATP